MTALLISIGIVALLSALLLLWVKVKIAIGNDLEIGVFIGPFKIRPDLMSKKKQKKSVGKTEAQEETKSEKTRNVASAVSDLIRVIKDYLIKHPHTVHFYTSKFYVKIGTDEAATTALECAAAKVASSVLFSLIDSITSIDGGCEKNVNIIPDFTKKVFECDIEVVFKSRLGSLLYALETLFFSFIKKTVKREIARSRKGK